MRAASAAPPMACIFPCQLSISLRNPTECFATVFDEVTGISGARRGYRFESEEMRSGVDVRWERQPARVSQHFDPSRHCRFRCVTFGGMIEDTMAAVWFARCCLKKRDAVVKSKPMRERKHPSRSKALQFTLTTLPALSYTTTIWLLYGRQQHCVLHRLDLLSHNACQCLHDFNRRMPTPRSTN